MAKLKLNWLSLLCEDCHLIHFKFFPKTEAQPENHQFKHDLLIAIPTTMLIRLAWQRKLLVLVEGNRCPVLQCHVQSQLVIIFLFCKVQYFLGVCFMSPVSTSLSQQVLHYIIAVNCEFLCSLLPALWSLVELSLNSSIYQLVFWFFSYVF
jgi:hypothetical protein